MAILGQAERAIDAGEALTAGQGGGGEIVLAGEHAGDCRGIEGEIGQGRRRRAVFALEGGDEALARGGVEGRVPGALQLAELVDLLGPQAAS